MSEAEARGVHAALDALDAAGVAFAFRKGQGREDVAGAREIDIELAGRDRRAADEALRRAGFELLRAPGTWPHRFYLAHVAGRWLKLDAKLEGRRPALERPNVRRAWSKVARRFPVSPKRAGPVVALVGPDGAGKGSVIERLQAEIPLAVSVLYLGWRPPRRRLLPESRGNGRERSALRECAGLMRGHLRTSRGLLRGYAAAWSGTIVLCDRHPLEALAVQPRRTPAGAALERLLLRRLTPWPDAIVVLDAPVEVLRARKDEHPPETLERWREGYRRAFGGRPEAAFVSTDGPLDASTRSVSEIVWRALVRRRGWTGAGFRS